MTDYKKPTRGRPPIPVTEDDRARAARLAGYGLKHDQIASELGISVSTLQRRFSAELKRGHATAAAKVAATAYELATSGTCPPMTMFWLKTRCGWKETAVQEITGKDGGPLELSNAKSVLLHRIDTIIARRDGSTELLPASTDGP